MKEKYFNFLYNYLEENLREHKWNSHMVILIYLAISKNFVSLYKTKTIFFILKLLSIFCINLTKINLKKIK